MTVPQTPVVLSSRTFPATPPSTALGNLAWSADGQCAFMTRRGVHIVTPYLTSTLPPPPSLTTDSTLRIQQSQRKKADDAGTSRLPRSPSGEVPCWSTAIEVPFDASKDEAYGWGEKGEEGSAMVVDREGGGARRIAWGPSGMGDLGGCYLAVMGAASNVLVFAPRSNAHAKKWDEIADLTLLTKALIRPPVGKDGPMVPQMLEMRSTCMAWSPALPTLSMLGVDGSLLAVANRAGRIGLWTFADSATRPDRLEVVDTGRCWVNAMAWSAWREVDEETCEADLAISHTDGSVSVIPIRRSARITSNGRSWSCNVGALRTVDSGDKRSVTGMKWIDTILVWTKPGSVHFFAEGQRGGVSWDGVRQVRLERVGNWAGANALTACVGIDRLTSDTIAVTLSSQTQHLITSILSSPTLAPSSDSLHLSLASREASLEVARSEGFQRDRFKVEGKEGERAITVHTSGWEALGGGVVSWVSEPIIFHNLDSASDADRLMNLVIADLSSIMPDKGRPSVLEDLGSLLGDPPALIHTSSIRLLGPFLMRMLASPRPAIFAQGLHDLIVSPPNDVVSPGRDGESLTLALWGDKELDRLRLKLVLAIWASTALPDAQVDSGGVAASLGSAISDALRAKLRRWTTTRDDDMQDGFPTDSFDARFLRAVNGRGGRSEAMDVDGDGAEEGCPACAGAMTRVGRNTMSCASGHDFPTCSVTQLLVSSPTCRACSNCPAVSLLPSRLSGSGVGDQRLVDEALNAAVACVQCSGRWVRVP